MFQVQLSKTQGTFSLIREEGAIVSMAPLGSSPGGEVFYVSSEESGSHNLQDQHLVSWLRVD